MHVYVDTFRSPVGHLSVALSENDEVVGIWVRESLDEGRFEAWLKRQGYEVSPSTTAFLEVRRQFADYFAGKRSGFDLPLLQYGTDFERAVWKEIRFIPYGGTLSYGEIADAIGHPGEAQRVGQACAANPWLIVVPCHRVVAADGSLRGYAAGLHIKDKLLSHERGQVAMAI